LIKLVRIQLVVVVEQATWWAYLPLRKQRCYDVRPVALAIASIDIDFTVIESPRTEPLACGSSSEPQLDWYLFKQEKLPEGLLWFLNSQHMCYNKEYNIARGLFSQHNHRYTIQNPAEHVWKTEGKNVVNVVEDIEAITVGNLRNRAIKGDVPFTYIG